MIQTEADREAAPCHVGRRPCGCVGFAAVVNASHKRDVAREIAACIRDGWTMETQTVAWVRSNWGPGCRVCNPEKFKVADQMVMEL